MKCAETAGFLLQAPCDHEASTTCQSCRKPVCDQHVRLAEKQLVCIACYKQWISLNSVPETQGSRLDSRRSRYDYYDPFLYHQYYYQDYDPYRDSSYSRADREAFARRADPTGGDKTSEKWEDGYDGS